MGDAHVPVYSTDLQGDPALEREALDAAAACRSVIDAAIAKRRASGETKDDVLGRCLVMQAAGLPGMDDPASAIISSGS